MKKPIAILDVDGVLLDLTPNAIEYVRTKHGTHINETHISDWDWDYCLGLPGGMSNEFWEFMWSHPAKPYPGAIELVRTLKGLGYFIQAISARSNHPDRPIDGARAAYRDFPQLELDDLILESDKAPLIKKQFDHAKFMIEDNPINAVEVCHNTNVPVYLMNRPWNERAISVTNAWRRLYNYKEIIDIAIKCSWTQF